MLLNNLLTYLVLFGTINVFAQSMSLSTFNTVKVCDGYIEATGLVFLDTLNPQAIVPRTILEIDNIKKIGANDGTYFLMLDSSGTLWSVGNNLGGSLGLGDTINRAEPDMIGEFGNVVDVMAFGFGRNSMALKDNGMVWVWGGNGGGLLGLGDSARRLVPTQLKSLRNVSAIGKGTYNVFAATDDGVLWGWGSNQRGQIGDGTTQPTGVPVKVKKISDVVQVGAGDFHTVALDAYGQVWTWGDNSGGLLGDTSRGFFDEEPQILKFDEDIKQVAVGKNFAIALTTEGKMWGWGSSSTYQLGFKDSTIGVRVPVALGYFDEVQSVQCGDYNCAAITGDGELWMWGQNGLGQIGDSTTNAAGQPPTLSDRFCLADKASPVRTSMKVSDVTIQYTLADYIITIGLPGESIPDNNVVQIYDVSGKLIRQQRLTQVENRFSTQGWTAGVYFISVSGENGNASKTIAVP